ncbi:MAG: flagellar hook-basal body complex protein [Planctomycetes bacterium]|nr:flagellar hook-basal body complex protein [Planctomycetota bacterium]MCH8118460.1 flagellar hook-basal body complex protein [Planctomycetota bacterium]
MSFALSAGVTGLQAHQKMIDVAGNNLANVNTTAFKASRITFSELLSETIKKASQPTSTVGGTNPQQMGTGVGVAGITPNTTQGNIVNTGNPLDLALEGKGYFVVSDGQQDIYTRAGAFAVDADSIMVDPSTGYRVQRIGSLGESDGFQTAGDSDLHVPYDVPMPARLTSQIVVSGNLSVDSTFGTVQTQLLSSNATYTSSGATAVGTTLINDLDQTTSGTYSSATITVSGYEHDGTALVDGTPLTVDGTTTLDDLVSHINTVLGATNATASLDNGQIRITDVSSGYSRSDVKLAFANSGTADWTEPAYFEMLTVGGDEVRSVNIKTYDSQGGKHVFSGAFVRTDTPNTWDMVLTSITGNINEITIANRRIEDITFDATNGYYTGLGGSDPAEFVINFAQDPSNPQTINIDFGTIGKLNGLTQFAGNSTAVTKDQDGYEAGNLSTVSINKEGIVIGAFSNGIKKDIGAIKISLFQNASGLESVGGGYFTTSANSGEPVATQAMTGGAGSIHGGALEKSNSDVATQFVAMIQAQNGFQANARTIRVANDILRELSNLIR